MSSALSEEAYGVIRYLRMRAAEMHETEGQGPMYLRWADVIERLLSEWKGAEQYAKDGWDWLQEALDALGVETVFDIPDSKSGKRLRSARDGAA